MQERVMSNGLTIRQCILREMRANLLQSVLTLVLVAIATGCLTVQWALWRGDQQQTARMLRDRERALTGHLDTLAAGVRNAAGHLGVNALIVPCGQQLDDLYAPDFAARTLPAEDAVRLAALPGLALDAVTPALMKSITWPEQQRRIILVGLQSSPRHGAARALPALSPGEMALGHELHQSLRLASGMAVRAFGQTFTLRECLPARGNRDDITAWIALPDMQRLAGMPGQVNVLFGAGNVYREGILADLRAQVKAVSPGMQVVPIANRVTAQMAAYEAAAQATRDTLASERDTAHRLLRARARLHLVIGLLVLGICLTSVALLALANVRDRQAEIGILRALGFRLAQIRTLVLGRAALLGTLGGLLGVCVGMAVALPLLCARGESFGGALAVSAAGWAAPVLAAALALLASWPPAYRAAGMDPAILISTE